MRTGEKLYAFSCVSPLGEKFNNCILMIYKDSRYQVWFIGYYYAFHFLVCFANTIASL